MDSSPSQRAYSGLEWTSINRPSAPQAMAALAIGATRFHLPVAWLGSTMTGKWENSLMFGTADRSRVFRYSVSKVLMPRSYRLLFPLAMDIMYSGVQE